MPPKKNPYDFSGTPDNPQGEEQPILDTSDEYRDYKELSYLLLGKGVPIERIHDLINRAPIVTVEDMASVNAGLIGLTQEFGIDRNWLLSQVEKRKRRANLNPGGLPKMSWLKKADGPEMEYKLPTKTRPDFGGPIDEGSMGEGMPPKPPMGPGGPGMGGKPPMGPGMGGKPGLGGPGGPKPPAKAPKGLDEIKMLLDKGDLQGAMDGLKKLLPGGGDKAGPGPSHRSPNLGKPPAPKPAGPPKPEDKGKPEGEPAKPAPKAKAEEDKGDKKASRTLHCGACNIVLEADCPTCGDTLRPRGSL